MIKTTLKHWIYELCIKQLFDAIKLNFSLFTPPNFKIGDKLKQISTITDDEMSTVYRNCRITKMLYPDSFMIEFTEKDVYTGNFEEISYSVGFDEEVMKTYVSASMNAIINRHNIVNIIK